MRIYDAEERDFWAGKLNPKFWSGEELIPAVRSRLLAIALDFYGDLGVEYTLTDIWLMGSSANYNWNETSDLDVHLFLEIPEEGREDILRWMSGERFLWNLNHDVRIKGHPVELYIQASGTSAYSQGVYSLLTDEWLSKPSGKVPRFDLREVTIKVDRLAADIALLEHELVASEYGMDARVVGDRAKFLRNRIMEMRRSGLLRGGEFDVDNLVYKSLRKEGWMDRLYEVIYKAYDKTWSKE